MCVPVKNVAEAEPQDNGHGNGDSTAAAHSRALAADDLLRTRREVVQEVYKAPEKRLDNMVTRLYDSARLLHMHSVVADRIRREHSALVWKRMGAAAGVGLGATVSAPGWTRRASALPLTCACRL